MALESLEQRRARVERDREHEARNAEAIAAERRAIDAMHGRSSAPRHDDKMLRAGGETKTATPPNPIGGIDFASDAAAELAAGAGLTAKDFKGKQATGASGFTKRDVQKLIG